MVDRSGDANSPKVAEQFKGKHKSSACCVSAGGGGGDDDHSGDHSGHCDGPEGTQSLIKLPIRLAVFRVAN